MNVLDQQRAGLDRRECRCGSSNRRWPGRRCSPVTLKVSGRRSSITLTVCGAHAARGALLQAAAPRHGVALGVTATPPTVHQRVGMLRLEGTAPCGRKPGLAAHCAASDIGRAAPASRTPGATGSWRAQVTCSQAASWLRRFCLRCPDAADARPAASPPRTRLPVTVAWQDAAQAAPARKSEHWPLGTKAGGWRRSALNRQRRRHRRSGRRTKAATARRLQGAVAAERRTTARCRSNAMPKRPSRPPSAGPMNSTPSIPGQALERFETCCCVGLDVEVDQQVAAEHESRTRTALIGRQRRIEQVAGLQAALARGTRPSRQIALVFGRTEMPVAVAQIVMAAETSSLPYMRTSAHAATDKGLTSTAFDLELLRLAARHPARPWRSSTALRPSSTAG
jgi:hypothetical protein